MSEFSSKRHSVRSDSISSRNSLSPGKESTAGKKRESRPRTRKVTSLTAEQLERKRANDREAQRTIRQRTKEHIEQLERQVADLSVRGEQMEGLLQRNAALEREISYLRQQLAAIGSGRLGSVHDGIRRSPTMSNDLNMTPPPNRIPHRTDSIPQEASVPPDTRRMLLSQNWQPYIPTMESPSGDCVSDVKIEKDVQLLSAHHSDSLNTQLSDNMAFGFSNPTPYLGSDVSHHMYVPNAQVHQDNLSHSAHVVSPPLGQRQASLPTMAYEGDSRLTLQEHRGQEFPIVTASYLPPTKQHPSHTLSEGRTPPFYHQRGI
ncbi:putative bZIP transcription factor [Elaphomyces granulatus]